MEKSAKGTPYCTLDGKHIYIEESIDPTPQQVLFVASPVTPPVADQGATEFPFPRAAGYVSWPCH